jgi:hypothetical protein
LGSGYGLNEKPKTANDNSLAQPGLRASPRFGGLKTLSRPPTPFSKASGLATWNAALDSLNNDYNRELFSGLKAAGEGLPITGEMR